MTHMTTLDERARFLRCILKGDNMVDPVARGSCNVEHSINTNAMQ